MFGKTGFSDLDVAILSLTILLGLGFLLAAGIIDLADGNDRTRKWFIFTGVVMIIFGVIWYIFKYLKWNRVSHQVYDGVKRR